MGWFDTFRDAFTGATRVDALQIEGPQLPDAPPMELPPGPTTETMAGRMLSGLRRQVDSIRNMLTGLGTLGDKGQAGRPDIGRVPLNYLELLALYRWNAYVRRFVDLWPDNATRKGWKVTEPSQETDLVSGEDQRLDIPRKVNEGLKWGGLFGTAVGVLVTTDDVPPEFTGREAAWLLEPLDLDRVISLDNIVILDRNEAQPWVYDGDIRSPNFRQPKLWQISPNVNATITGLASGMIHASRVVVFPGAALPASWRFANYGYDDSVVEQVWDQVRGLTSMDQAAYLIAQEANVDVLKIPGLDGIKASDQAVLFDARVLGLAKSKSVANMAIIGKDDVYERRSVNLAGWKDLKDHAREAYAGGAGIPQTIAFGDTPSGLNTDGESGRRNFHDDVASYQQNKVKPILREIYTVVFNADDGPTQGEEPEEWDVEFAPLDEVSLRDQVELEKVQAETDTIRIDAGLVPTATITKSRYGEKGYQWELLPLEGVEDMEVSAEDLAAMRELVAEADGVAPGSAPAGAIVAGAAGADGDGAAQDTALNGAQVTAALAIVQEVVGRRLTPAMARAMLVQFFNLSSAGANEILAGAERLAAAAPPPAAGAERTDAAEDRALLFVPLPEQAEADWLANQDRVAAILGEDFQRSGFPHVTVLFLGEVEADQVGTVANVSAGVVADVRAWPAHVAGVSAFPAGPDGTPIVLRTWGPFSELNDRLIRALAPEVSARQFPEYRPHATLGFLTREITPEEVAQILQLGLEDDDARPWVPTEVVLRVGAIEAGRFPLSLRLDATAAK